MNNPRLPPQDLQAERGVLGSILLQNDCLDDVAEVELRADHFYLPAHRDLFLAIQAIHRADRPADAVTLARELERVHKLSEIGGVAYLEEILAAVPHSAHARHYAEIVKERAWRRAILGAGHDAMKAAYDESRDVDAIITQAESGLHAVLEERIGSMQSALDMHSLMVEAWDSITAERTPGIETGYPGLDALTLGFQPGNLVIVAARPSVGKTALACNLAWHLAEAGAAVLFHSLEQSRLELAERFLSSASGVSGYALKTRNLRDEQRDAIMEAAARLGDLPITVDDHPRNLSQINAVARLHKRRKNLQVLFVDYLQLLDPDDPRAPREQQVAASSRGLKRLAKALGITVVCLAQLNREIEKRPDKKPRLSDLRESGAVEQDGDLILFVDRPHLYDENAAPSEAKLHIAKHRNGQTGVVDLAWDGPTMTFSPVDLVEQYAEQGQFGFSNEFSL